MTRVAFSVLTLNVISRLSIAIIENVYVVVFFFIESVFFGERTRYIVITTSTV